MRFAAHYFVKLLQKRPSLETAAFFIVGWVGVKLAVFTLAHDAIGVLPHDFPHSTAWEVTFWGVMLLIVALGFFFSREKGTKTNAKEKEQL